MRLIDADELRKHTITVYQGNGVELEPIEVVPLAEIDNAPTVKPYCYFCGQKDFVSFKTKGYVGKYFER